MGAPVVAGAVLAAALSACSGGAGGGTGGGGGQATTTSGSGGAGVTSSTAGMGGSATSSTGGTGGATSSTTTSSTGGTGGGIPQQPYPPGPYGYAVGSTITNYGFDGFAAPLVSTSAVQLVQLGDFYNPTGQGTYPVGSPYGAGAALPRVLMLHAAAVWAGPSNLEAQQIIPAQLAAFGPCFQVMDVLLDGLVPGMPAKLANAASWATKYHTPYPVVIDPAAQLMLLFTMQAYPTNILVDTKTMAILEVLTGVPDDAWFQSKVAPHCP